MKPFSTLAASLLALASAAASADPVTLVTNTLLTDDAPSASLFGPITPGYEVEIGSMTISNFDKAEGAWVAIRVLEVTAASGSIDDCLDASPRRVVAELHRVKIEKEGTIHLAFPLPIALPVIQPDAGDLWCIQAELPDIPGFVSRPNDAQVWINLQGTVTDLTP